MSNRPNHRRGERRRTETGPRYENPNPGAGCNATHVARARRAWKRLMAKAHRRSDRQAFVWKELRPAKVALTDVAPKPEPGWEPRDPTPLREMGLTLMLPATGGKKGTN